WIHLVAAFGAYFLGYFLFATRKRYLKVLTAIMLSAVIPVIVGIKQVLLREFFFSNDSVLPRIQATFWHPNKLGSFLFIVTAVYLVFYLSIKVGQEGAKKKLLFFLPFLVLIPLLGLTFSRTSWVALAFAIFVIAIMRRSLRKPAILLGGLLTVLALAIGKIRDRILDTFSWSMNNSVSGRIEIWDIGFFKLSQRPWLGFGPGSFGEVIKDARGSEEGNISAHSDAVRFVVEGGIVGLLAYFLYFIGAIVYAFISFVRYPQSSKRVKILNKEFLVDFKLLGFIPFLLFLSMIPISFMETSTLDFVYQFFAWIALGSWLAVSGKTIKTRKKRRATQRRKEKELERVEGL
ncbi:MAG: O-antigen ligase family protein, partial [Patescibacteria group bacterium]|nr:O-antigen ligase family protein [Patescibacteria group bacterium]